MLLLGLGMKLINDFEKNWQQNMVLPQPTAVLVACSGGIDSLALLHLLFKLEKKLGIKVYAAHFEHGIRGESAIGDALFVQDFCKELGVRFFLGSGDVPKAAKAANESLETAARRLRYAFLHSIKDKIAVEAGCNVVIATAHHGDDQAETVLMHLLRGSGLRGLAGIKPCQQDLIRPLLFARKSDLAEYCQHFWLLPRHDETNDVANCLRNKIRLELLPQLKANYNPALTAALCQTAELAQADEDFLHKAVLDLMAKLVHKNQHGFHCSCQELAKQHIAIQRRLVQQMAVQLGTEALPFNQVQAVLQLLQRERTGASLELSFCLMAKISYKNLYIIKKNISFSENNVKMDNEVECAVPSSLRLPDGSLLVTSISDAVPEDADGKYKVYADLAKCQLPLVVRHRQNGDRVRLSHGHKKLKDFLIDEKIPREQRGSLWLVTSGEEILWMPKVRRFAAALADEKTKKYIILHIQS